ncbi:hypothetical protein Syun_028453 [Stephania yunnanensis]|uniref:Methyltransferase domain-containing protein n=1 Tax=Stephania yunnanensis TaxID=152371 RepID=A0AAP0EMM9_9MAGN
MRDKVVGDKGLMMKPITKSEVVEKVMLGLIRDEEDKSATLDDAEKAMLDLYCERAQIKDGHRILDLGCGYGAFAIHVASKYPHCHVIGITDTTSHKKFIEEQCKNQNLNNVEVILGDITKYELNKEFDRVMVLGVLENDVSIVNHWVLNGKHVSRTRDKVVGDKGLMMKPITKSEVVEKVMLGLIPDEEVKMLIKDQLQRRTDWIYSHNFEQRFALLHNFVECKLSLNLHLKA